MLCRNYNENWIVCGTPQNVCDYFSLIKVAKVYENGFCCPGMLWWRGPRFPMNLGDWSNAAGCVR